MSKAEESAVKSGYSRDPLYRVEYTANDVWDAFIDGFEEAEKDVTEELIDKVIGWIEELNNNNHIIRYSDSCEPPISELTEWFKNYMKGE